MPPMSVAFASVLLTLSIASVAAQGQTFVTVPLAGMPESSDKRAQDSLTFSGDLSRVAYITGQPPRVHVVVDGKAGPDFQDIPVGRLSEAGRVGSLAFSPDSKHFAYVAATDQGRVLVRDHQAGKAYEEIAIGRFAFSPDSQHVVVIAAAHKKEMVILDGVEGKGYDFVEEIVPKFSPDSQHVYYSARTRGGEGQDDHCHIVFDTREMCDRPFVSNLTFSPDRAHYAYVARQGEEWIVVYDNMPGPSTKSVGNSLVFNADSKHFLYRGDDAEGNERLFVDGKPFAFKGTIQEAGYGFDPLNRAWCYLLTREGRFAVHGEERLGPFDYTFGSMTFSPDGKHFAFPIIEKVAVSPDHPHGEQRRYVIDGKAQEACEDLEYIQFSADSAHYVYSMHQGKQQVLILDGKGVATAESFRAAEFSGDGKHMVFVARRDNKDVLYWDQKEIAAADMIHSIAVSRDGGRVAGIAHSTGQSVNNVETGGTDTLILYPAAAPTGPRGTFEELEPPMFSPDGRHLLVLGRSKGEWRWHVDNVASTPFDGFPFPGTVLFDSPAACHTLALKGKTYIRVNVTLSEK